MAVDFDLSAVFETLQHGFDIVVKRPASLPRLSRGGDLDVFSIRPNQLCQAVSAALAKDFPKVEVAETDSGSYHVDAFDEAGFAFRTDITAADRRHYLPIRPSFFHRAIGRAVLFRVNHLEIPVAEKSDEAIIRYFEYVFCFWTGRDKLHHLDWLTQELTEDERREMFELVHLYVAPSNQSHLEEEPRELRLLLSLIMDPWRNRVRRLRRVAGRIFSSTHRGIQS